MLIIPILPKLNENRLDFHKMNEKRELAVKGLIGDEKDGQEGEYCYLAEVIDSCAARDTSRL